MQIHTVKQILEQIQHTHTYRQTQQHRFKYTKWKINKRLNDTKKETRMERNKKNRCADSEQGCVIAALGEVSADRYPFF